jgi:ribosome maturation protein Sdo1
VGVLGGYEEIISNIWRNKMNTTTKLQNIPNKTMHTAMNVPK